MFTTLSYIVHELLINFQMTYAFKEVANKLTKNWMKKVLAQMFRLSPLLMERNISLPIAQYGTSNLQVK